MKNTTRIGVFVCHCGVNIGGVINIQEIIDHANTLPNVVYAEGNLYSCSSQGINNVKEAIKIHDLNRVVVASCTPRTHEPLFRNACEEAGLNKYLFQMVNIREQCSWVHTPYPEKATEKAKYLLQMAVMRASLLEPQEEIEIEIEPSSLVIGAGVSGMAASLSLANQGFKVYLVEKEKEMGGILNSLHHLYPTGQKAFDILNSLVSAVKTHENIELLTSTTITEVSGYLGDFAVKTVVRGREVTFKVGTIIVATGAIEYEPVGLYGYGKCERVITQLGLERLLTKGFEEKPDVVTMIQCVGAMEEKGRTYCSRICCMVAVKNALLIKELYPETEVYLLYRDLQTYGEEYEYLYRRAREQFINFIKYAPESPPKVMCKKGEKTIVRVYDVLLGGEVEIKSDLLALSTPLIQHAAGKELSSILKVPLGPDEFFLEAHAKLRPVDFSSEGIYVCGTAHGPKDVAESIAQAYAAASRAAIPMAQGKVKADAVKASVDVDLCVGCGACAASCPFDAIKLLPFGQPTVIEVSCKGCGVCAVECPMGAMQLRHFKDDQLVSEIDALLMPEKWMDFQDSTEPVIVCFACKWCAYAAADLAGIMRLEYPVNVRIILVPCSGRVDTLHILTAFMRGADGVIVAGCLKGGCHYTDGNLKAERRIEAIKKALDVVGVGKDRLEMYFMGAGMPDKFVESVTAFTKRVKKLPFLTREHVSTKLITALSD